MTPPPAIATTLKALLALWFVMATYLQHDIGLADNGDFWRSMLWITPGPVGMASEPPPAGTDAWELRFANYWLPYWKLEWTTRLPRTSALVLWLPGAVLNYLCYSSQVLYVPALSLFPRLILFAVLQTLLRWILRHLRHATLFAASLAAPIAVIVTTTDYAVYLNTFYQDTASMIFLFMFLAFLVRLDERASVPRLGCAVGAILLLATAKSANVYWPFVAMPFVVHAWRIRTGRRFRGSIAAGILAAALLSGVSLAVTGGGFATNRYHSLFYGALVFSSNPAAHLRALGMEDGAACVNTSAFSTTGAECLRRYARRLSFLNTLAVFRREPAVFFKLWKHALDNMQDVSLEYLGHYAPGDPRSAVMPRISGGTESRFWSTVDQRGALNSWSRLKFASFPTGYVLLAVLAGFAAWFVRLALASESGIARPIGRLGLLLTFACGVDMIVAVLGDGKGEIVKHLLLSNLMFDIAGVLFVNSLLTYWLERRAAISGRGIASARTAVMACA